MSRDKNKMTEKKAMEKNIRKLESQGIVHLTNKNSRTRKRKTKGGKSSKNKSRKKMS